jgi:hypothetical protein
MMAFKILNVMRGRHPKRQAGNVVRGCQSLDDGPIRSARCFGSRAWGSDEPMALIFRH